MPSLRAVLPAADSGLPLSLLGNESQLVQGRELPDGDPDTAQLRLRDPRESPTPRPGDRSPGHSAARSVLSHHSYVLLACGPSLPACASPPGTTRPPNILSPFHRGAA